MHIGVMAVWLGLWAQGRQVLHRRMDPRQWIKWIDPTGGVLLIAFRARTDVSR